MSIGFCVRLAASALACVLSTAPLAAQDAVEQFYKGKQISVIVGSSSVRTGSSDGSDQVAPLRRAHPHQR